MERTLALSPDALVPGFRIPGSPEAAPRRCRHNEPASSYLPCPPFPRLADRSGRSERTGPTCLVRLNGPPRGVTQAGLKTRLYVAATRPR